MRSYRRANNRRAHYDPISDSVTPMSQSELAAEAEAVFDIVFDEDPNALSQSGVYSKIFDYFKRYGISNDYSDAVDMAIYIEENLLRHSRRANRKARFNTNGKSAMNHTHRRAFRKTADESHNGWTNYETWYIKSIIDNDYELYKKSRSRSVYSTDRIVELVRYHPLNELSDSDMQKVNWSEILKDLVRERNELNGYTSHRANRKTASERMNYGDVYTVHSDGSITVHSIGDQEWVDITVYEEELNNDYMYDWDAIEAELYEGVVSSIGGAEPVEVVSGYFISSMSGVDVDDLADLGPGEYRLCPVSLTYLDGEGDSPYSEYDDGFDYDVVVRY